MDLAQHLPKPILSKQSRDNPPGLVAKGYESTNPRCAHVIWEQQKVIVDRFIFQLGVHRGARICSSTFCSASPRCSCAALSTFPPTATPATPPGEEIYEPAGLTPLCSVPQGTNTASALFKFFFFSAWRVPLAVTNAAWHRASKAAGANFSSLVPHGEEGTGLQ